MDRPFGTRISTQTLALGVVPLVFLAALLVLALVVQGRDAAIATQSQRSAAVIAEVYRELQALGSASRSVIQYKHTMRPSSLAPFYATERNLPAAAAALPTLVADDPPQHRRAMQISAYMREGVVFLREYAAAVRRRDEAAQLRIQREPALANINKNLTPLMAAFAQSERIANAARIARIRKQATTLTIGLIAVGVVGTAATLLILLLFGLRITRRLEQLASNARRLAAGESAPAIGGRDEFAELDSVYKTMTALIRQEQDRSSVLQQALLPQSIPTFPGLRLDAAYATPGREVSVGGDWYDVFRISEQLIGISIGDVAGHGIRAAAIMASARHAIRTVAHLQRDPATVLQHVNTILCRSEAAPLATAVYATFNVLDGTLEYCVAGHPPPMLVRTGSVVQEMPGHQGLLLGVDSRLKFETQRLQMDVGSALVLYTDGIVEAARNYFRGMSILREAIEAEYRNGAGNIAQAIQDRVFSSSTPRDDCALLFIGVTALGEAALAHERVIWTIDARIEESARRVKRAILWHLGEIAQPGCDLSLSEMILAEMIGNVARHTPGPADVTLEWKGSVARVSVFDKGRQFDPPVQAEAADPFAESGRGIFLIRALSPEFSVRWTGEGNCVSAVLPVAIGGFAPLPTALSA